MVIGSCNISLTVYFSVCTCVSAEGRGRRLGVVGDVLDSAEVSLEIGGNVIGMAY